MAEPPADGAATTQTDKPKHHKKHKSKHKHKKTPAQDGIEGQAAADGKPLPADTQVKADPLDIGKDGNVVIHGLPGSWQATVLDRPPAPPPPVAQSATAGAGKLAPGVPPQPLTAEQVAAAASVAPQTPVSVSRVLIPISARVGLAAFRSGNRFLIVVDNVEPLDTSALRGDGLFSTLTVDTLPDATLIQVYLPDTRNLYLSQQAEGWVLGDKPPPGNAYGNRRILIPQTDDAGVLYPMRKPGRVLAIKDPVSGQKLLVGTSAFDDGGVLSFRKGQGYDVWPSVEGVVVSPNAPDITMKATARGALLMREGKPLLDEGVAIYANDVDSEWLGLNNLSDLAMEKQFQATQLAAADSSPADRFARRLDAARAAFSNGDALQARAILTVALQDDPEESARPDVRFLLAAAELLCGNMDGASLLDEPWPEAERRATQLWRGLYDASIGGQNADAAHTLALDFKRIESYPSNIRAVLLPFAAEHIGRYGTPQDMAALDGLPAEPVYDLAKAFKALRTGKRKEAIDTFQKLETNRDPVIAEKALEQTTALQLSDGKITPEKAADKFESLLLDARLAGREAMLRLLQADAYIRARKWSDALTALAQAKAYAPKGMDTVMSSMLSQILLNIARDSTGESNHDALLHDAAMLRAHMAELPTGPQKAEVVLAYGKLLMSLDLPDQAQQAFSDAIPMFDKPDLRALAGNALATAYLDQKQPALAANILTRTDDPALSDDVRAARHHIQARVALESGDQTTALGLLGADQAAVSLDMSAHIHENKGEWAAAVADLRRMAETDLPPKGTLTPAQQFLALRIASDASQAGDKETLSWLLARIGSRSLDGDTGRVFGLLTAQESAAKVEP